VLPQYLCYFMKCSSSRKKLIDGGNGTNIKSLNQQTLFNLNIPFPSASEQKALVAKLDLMSEETQRLESIYRRKLAVLDELKKSLLHQAFNGEL
jgi:type I restriction enzyme, S subunit